MKILLVKPLGACFFLLGCGDCYSTEYSVSQFLNKDSGVQTIEFCRADNPNEVKSITIPSNEQESLTWSSKKIYNRFSLSSACHDQHDEEKNIAVLLTPASQNIFRLCSDALDRYLIVLRHQACPTDTSEITDSCQ